MGTEYVLLKKGIKDLVSLFEMSNRFDLCIFPEHCTACGESLNDLSTDDVIKISMEMLLVSSYWTTEEEFTLALKTHMSRYLDAFLEIKE